MPDSVSTKPAASCLSSLLVLMMALGACDPGEAPGAAFEMRDSSGIQVVTNLETDSVSGMTRWTLELITTIGTVNGPEETNFGTVADLAFGANGHIHILDRQASTVRTFALDGSFVRSVGGLGEGPGELSTFTYSVLGLENGSIVVPDRRQGRFTLFDSAGDVRRVVPIEGGIPTMRWGGTSLDRLVVRSLQNSMTEDGQFRSWDGVVAMGEDGTIRDTLMVVPEGVNVRMGEDGPVAPLLIVGPIWDVLEGDRVAVATTDQVQISVLGPAGALERIVRYDGWRRASVSSSDAERMRELFLQRYTASGMDPAQAAARFASVTGMDRFPAFVQVLAGPAGGFLVRRMGALDEIDPSYLNAAFFERLGSTSWDVFDADGVRVAELTTPEGVDLMEISDTLAAGVHRDTLGVQTVQLFRIGGTESR